MARLCVSETWDMRGIEVTSPITTAYLRGALGALLVYDITNRTTFGNVESWLNVVRGHAEIDRMVVILVGNKCDMDSNSISRKVSLEEGAACAAKFGLSFMETSAVKDTNIYECFKSVLTKIYEHPSNRYHSRRR